MLQTCAPEKNTTFGLIFLRLFAFGIEHVYVAAFKLVSMPKAFAELEV